MKKLAIIMLLTVTMFAVKAQTATYQLTKGTTFLNVATDYTLTDAVNQYFIFKAENNNPLAVDYKVILTTVTGNHTNITVVLSGRKFSGDTWTTIATGTTPAFPYSNPEKITISFPGTLQYREFKVSFTGTGTGTTLISNQEFKVWYK